MLQCLQLSDITRVDGDGDDLDPNSQWGWTTISMCS